MGMMIVGKPEEDRPLRNGRLDGRIIFILILGKRV
jgi:hypothetical protein